MSVCSVEACGRSIHARGWCKKHYAKWSMHGDATTTLRLVSGTVEERLRHHGWDTTASGCWEFRSGAMKSGHCRIRMNGKHVLVHRLSYETWVGPIPEGQLIRHKCDNPPCMNPDHLEPGTHQDNRDDVMARGNPTFKRGSDHYASKVDEDQVRAIRAGYTSGNSLVSLSLEYGLSTSAIKKIADRRSWKHVE